MGLRIYTALMCLGLASACNLRSEPTDAGDTPMSVTETIGPSGGEITLAGAHIQVPAGALTDERVLTLRRGLPVPDGQEAYSEVFLLEPQGLALEIPAVVQISAEGEDPALFTVDDLGSKNLGAEVGEATLEAELATLGVIFGGKANPCGRLIQDDANNCGSCGRSCNNNSGVVSCREGTCEIRCNNGHGDCDSDADTGCEVDVREDPANCGGCGIACSENATCERQGDSSFCTCAEGFFGDGVACEELVDCQAGRRRVEGVCVDIDECAEGLDFCGESALCENQVGTFACSCPAGFEALPGGTDFGTGKDESLFECIDVDECALDVDDCSENAACENISGGFSCVCSAGFEGDGKTCLDVDECQLDLDTCASDANCTNTPGSFACACKSGYVGDGTFCQEVDECEGNVAGCDEHATCQNTPGAFLCSCISGYTGDGATCLDIDECSLGTDTCADNADCVNQDGGFACQCKTGFEGDGQTCLDVDECATGLAQCSPDASCTNVPGSFACECNAGYRGNGFACEDIDECFEELDTCSTDAVCSNRPGGFDCACDAGFVGDGFVCDDIDECQGANLCDENARCENTSGDYSCSCNPGFSGTGESCDDVDECQEVDICGAFGVCENTIGAFDCACESGFERIAEECVDIDECQVEECGEHGHCVNAPGDFSCQCDAGFVGDGTTCNDAAERAIRVEAGGAHTCALFDNNMVRCWGWGIYGELGHGDTEDIGVDNEPASSPYVQLGSTAKALSLGVTHTCAILQDDTLRCWGRNFYGPLGLGHTNDIGDTEIPSSSELALGGMRVAQVAGGGEHTCALDFDGDVYCWGLSVDGQTGYGTTSPLGDDEDPLSAGAVELLSTATQVVTGRDHSCALLDDGTVQCWGRGEHSPTGYGHTESIGDDELPIDAGVVDIGGSVQQLAAGWYHTCALLDDASVRCWGYGNLGALGYANRESIGDDELPLDAGSVDVGGPVRQLVAGTYHTCALLENGNVRCWGYGGDGQLGYGNTNTIGDNEHPFEAGDIDVGGHVTQITAGSFHTCALLDGGTVRCWGSREHGQLCYQGTENVGDDERPAAMGDCPILAAVCPAGFRLSEDGVTCDDIDECALEIDACSEVATCSNTEGSYECECDSGYEGDGMVCEDTDECANETDDCSEDATCINTDGSFECACNDGYFGDGVTCGGACATSNDDCDENAECTDGSGTYSCACFPGFVGDGVTCDDIDECALGLDSCDVNAGCINTPGSYECVCLETFVGTGEVCACAAGYEDVGGACADINECSRGSDNCVDGEICINTEGSFTCTGPGQNPDNPDEPLLCPDGYLLTGVSSASTSADTNLAFATVHYEAGPNDAIANAQRVEGLATIQGEANVDTDAIDIYRTQLAAGQAASLFVTEDGVQNDLELHLHTLSGEPVRDSSGAPIRSLTTTRFESVVAETSGTYLVVVQASAGASKYSLVFGQPLGASAVVGNTPSPRFVPGEVIVRFDPRANVAHSLATVAQGMGTQHASGQAGRAMLMRQSSGASVFAAANNSGLQIANDAIAMAKSWSRRPDVLSASPNFLYEASAIPNDEHFAKQWHYPAIRLPQAWDTVTDASAITVAVIDTGVILAHPDLENVLVPGYDFIRDPSRARDGDGIDDDADDVGDSASPGASSYHGTHVAGTVSAETDNGIGVAGVAQGARIMPLRALGAGGGSSYDIMQSVRFAAGMQNDSGTVPAQRADVINMSLGGAGRDPAFEALIAEVRALGVVVVAAAGNSSTSALAYPASYEGVISVSATDFDNGLSYYSNFGGAIDVAAPGGDVRVDRNGDGQGDGVFSTLGADSANGIEPIYKYYQGTSMASPHMAGVVALMRAANSELGPSDIDALLVSGAITTDLGPAGRDDSFGHGLINAEAAVLRAQEFVAGAPSPEQPLLVAEPTSMSFLDPAETAGTLALRNAGEGSLDIDEPSADAPWLQFGAVAVVDDVHSYPVIIDRAGLEVGSYSATITISSSVNTVLVPVVMEVQAPQCIDIDECELNLDDCANPEQNGDCRNLPGSFECFCFDGYEGDGKTCSDVDECADGTDTCSDFALCTNTEPGFTCECLDGFSGDGITCLPPNECELGLDTCDDNATCTDTFEGYECACDAGFVGDGTTCEDVNECDDGSHACDANAFCTNTFGAYDCTCSPHFTGSGSSCTPDEGCLSVESFEAEWPNAAWRDPYGHAVAGIGAASAARTGDLGLSQFDGMALHSPVALGEEQDALGVWIRLEDVGAAASLAFGSSDDAGVFLQADGSGALGLYRWTRHGEPELIREVFAAIPTGEWLYLDVFFHGDGNVSASLFGSDGVSSIAGLSGLVGDLSIGNPGLASTTGGADFDGLTACAFKPLVDECALGIDTCDDNATCNDLLGGYECVCNASFVGDGFSCQDENECETGNNSCSVNAICTNTIGAYECACSDGFTGDGFLCVDVDECELGTFECDENAACVNTPGSYDCACDAGYEGDGKTCTDIDECAIGTDTCADDAECTNTPGSFSCACLDGFEGDGFVCEDVDECALGLDSCHDAATCFNAEGSYTCECNGGWSGDGFECFDIDECALGIDSCDALAECSNSEGFYFCSCPDGFSGDGFSCNDIDECSAGLATCSAQADCINTEGDFACECKAGYQGNGTTCADVDECALGTDSCSEDGLCSNIEGGYDCTCAPGYEGTGFVCSDVDECTLGLDACSERALCSNTVGAYACDCRAGFEGDGFTCLDVDECAANTFDCPLNASCSNTDGGFDCTCRRGYRAGVDGVCEDVAVKAQSVGAGDAHTCALMNEGVVKCWGSGSNGRTGHGNTVTIGDDETAGDASIVDVTELAVVQLAVGGAHNCALLEDGSVRCWGLGQDGRLGYADDEDVGDDEVPADVGIVPMPSSAVQLALGQKHSCALLDGGIVSCWGDNAFGQLGAGPVPEPIRRNDAVDVGGAVTAIAAGDYHTCALLDSGDVVCWGLGSFGRLGYGDSNAVGVTKKPVNAGPVSLGGSAIALAAGANHSCALLESGELRCWGRALFGALGTGVAGDVGDNELPSDVAPVELTATPIAVTAGSSHTCVAFATGDVQCFGLGGSGQLGYGNERNIGDTELPSEAGVVDVGLRVLEIDAGAFHTCVVVDTAEVRCWGKGSLGQLGYGSTADVGDSEAPASVGSVSLGQ